MSKLECSNAELFEYLSEYDEAMWPCHEVVKRMKNLIKVNEKYEQALVTIANENLDHITLKPTGV